MIQLSKKQVDFLTWLNTYKFETSDIDMIFIEHILENGEYEFHYKEVLNHLVTVNKKLYIGYLKKRKLTESKPQGLPKGTYNTLRGVVQPTVNTSTSPMYKRYEPRTNHILTNEKIADIFNDLIK